MTSGENTRTILVVDDEEATRNAVTDVLTSEGYDVISSSSALDAIMKVVQARFDVAIVDILMPDLSGFDLIRVMNKLCPETVLVVLTAMQDTKEQFSKTAESSGVFAFLQKPWNFVELNDTIQKALNYKQVLNESRMLAYSR